MRERERESERETDRQTDRDGVCVCERERQRERENTREHSCVSIQHLTQSSEMFGFSSSYISVCLCGWTRDKTQAARKRSQCWTPSGPTPSTLG